MRKQQEWGWSRNRVSQVTPVQGVPPVMGHSPTGPEHIWQSQGLVKGSIDNLDTVSGAPGSESILGTQSELKGVRARDRAIIWI